MEKKFVQLKNKEKIAYLQAGSGDKTFIIIHGNMSTSRTMSVFPKNIKGYTVYAVDLRGFGDSTYNKPSHCLTDYAEDIVQFMDALEIKHAVIGGWSLGGGVALETAFAAPNRVRKLVLVNSTPVHGYPLFKQNADGTFAAYDNPEQLAAVPAIAASLNALNTKDTQYVRFALNVSVFNQKIAPSDDQMIAICEDIVKQRNLLDVDWALCTFNPTDAPSLYNKGTGQLAQLKCPILFTMSDNDLAVPIAWANKSLEAFGQNIEVVKFEQSGHAPFIDKEQSFFVHLQAFLDK